MKTNDAVLARLHATLNDQIRLFNEELCKSHPKGQLEFDAEGQIRVANIGRDWGTAKNDIDMNVQLLEQVGDALLFETPPTVLDCTPKVHDAYLRNVLTRHHGQVGGRFKLTKQDGGILVTRVAA